ncbi:methyltransferase [Microbacterium sp. B35-04]|uniref:methyltransferase domain-containing protein n=1 Tax=unclassified Microbacterium TaxID=2609290 RepID=UPI0013D8C506|nr:MULTISPECIES: methyltransferase domain-containing protein [unclassified Microbacterium]KAF2412587.1 methyltransferase [Microbacterium sp. B35-04]KAF2420857.1 methyltransferase [Microbacterium sp. B35-30]
MSFAVRDERLVELMDDPECDPDRLRATLRRFGTINRLVSGWGAVYRRTLAPHLATLGRPARVLDIGSGGGDLVVRLAAAGRRDGLDVQWTGIDPDPRSHEVALERGSVEGVTFRCAEAATLVAEGHTFDAVLSNHVLHHLGADLPAFVAESLELSRGLVLHSDIERSRLAYGLYAIGITPFAPGTFLRTDGLRSIRRSYTATELAAVLDEAMPGTWTVQTPAPFRVLATGHGRG